jgi:glucokinase
MVAAICPAACRFALANDVGAAQPVLTNYMECRTHEVSGALEAFGAYRTAVGGDLPSTLALSVAAPAAGDSFVITQSGWRISKAEFAQAFGFERIVAVNDAAAVGLALGTMDLRDAVPLGVATMPARPLANGRYGLIHLDFGLGVSAVKVNGGEVQVIDTEAGHLTFPPQNELEERLAARLRRKHGRVSYERLLSWGALAQIRAALAEEACDAGEPLSSLEVVLRARAGEPLSVEAMACYAQVLGGFAGDVALAMGLDGGVVLSGRYVFETIDHTDWAGFRERFEAKGRLADFVKALPTWALANPASVLIGAARQLSLAVAQTDAPSPAAGGERAMVGAPARGLAREVLNGAVCGLLVLDPSSGS